VAGKEIRSTKIASTKSKSTGFKKYGYVPDGKGVAPEYLVRITSYRNRCTIVGVLQEDIAMRVESRWEYLVPTSILDNANRLIQAVSGGKFSVITKATSRRVWQGSSPLQLSLNLKFEAVNNAFEEVVQPCKLLQAIALPSNREYEGAWNSEKGVPQISSKEKSKAKKVLGVFLSPPGPTPFTTKGLFTRDNTRSIDEVVGNLKGGDIIKVDLGRFLSFWNVIVKEVIPIFHLKFTSDGDPISANVNIIFESYEMMTAESLIDAYSKSTFSSKASSEATKGKVVKSKVKKVK